MSEENPTNAEIEYLAKLQVVRTNTADRTAPALAREVLRLRAGFATLRQDVEQAKAKILAETDKIEATAKRLAPIEADARRFRWLLDGNGYFMEENHLCGHAPVGQKEKEEACAEIDKAIIYGKWKG